MPKATGVQPTVTVRGRRKGCHRGLPTGGGGGGAGFARKNNYIGAGKWNEAWQ